MKLSIKDFFSKCDQIRSLCSVILVIRFADELPGASIFTTNLRHCSKIKFKQNFGYEI